LLSSLSLSGQLGVKAILRSGVSAGKAVLSKIGTVENVRAAFCSSGILAETSRSEQRGVRKFPTRYDRHVMRM